MKILILAFYFFSVSVFAQDVLKASDTIVYSMLGGSMVTAGYGSFKNETSKKIALKLLEVEPFKKVETHETTEKNGMAQMNKISQVVIQPGEVFVMKPGGHHIMLFEPSRKINPGETLKAVFLVNGQKQKVDFNVVDRMAIPPR